MAETQTHQATGSAPEDPVDNSKSIPEQQRDAAADDNVQPSESGAQQQAEAEAEAVAAGGSGPPAYHSTSRTGIELLTTSVAPSGRARAPARAAPGSARSVLRSKNAAIAFDARSAATRHRAAHGDGWRRGASTSASARQSAAGSVWT